VVYAFDQNGACLERNLVSPAPPLAAFQANHGPGVMLLELTNDPHPGVPLDKLRGLIEDGLVTGLEADTAWTPPGTPDPPTPAPDLLAELAAKVDRLPISIHSTRAEDQKEILKAFAIPWVKAHPEASAVEAGLAIMAALRAEFPSDPIVGLIYDKDLMSGREDGLLMSYADAAHTAGLTPDKSWQALRALIVAAPEQQLREALRRL
jgi:hypothetical protein